MQDNPEAQEPRKASHQQDQEASPAKTPDEISKVVQEAAQAEAEGLYAHASLLALHALQQDPARAEASEIFERCQVALGRKKSEIEAPGFRESKEGRPFDTLFKDDALRHPIDLNGVPPLMPASIPRGLGSRIGRTVLPILVLGLFIAGIWLTSRPVQTLSPPVPAQPAVAEPDPGSASGSERAALVPGTASLNIVPWAKVDSIFSVYEGHEIEPEGLVSPCTISLPPGKYGFTVSHPDFGSIELPVVVKSGEVTKVEHSLISSQELEKELAPALRSVGFPRGYNNPAGMRQSAELRR